MDTSLLGTRVRFEWRDLNDPKGERRELHGRVVLVTCAEGDADSVELLVAVGDNNDLRSEFARLYPIKNIEAVRFVVESLEGGSL